MPRPGPRPYECVRRAWHSDRHQPMRGSIIQQIFRLVNEAHSPVTKKNREWQEKLPIVVLKAEEIMYSKANSEAEYMDLATLWDRVNDAINTIIRKDDSTETGELLQPCIEAALNLGCDPVRASRSQRHNNLRSYLTPRTQDTSSAPPKVLDNTTNARCPQLPPPPRHSGNQLTFARATTANSNLFVPEPDSRVTQSNNPNAPRRFPFLCDNLSPGSNKSVTMESKPPLNLGLVYPLYYGTHYQTEGSQLGFPTPDNTNANPIFVGTPIGTSIQEPAEMGVVQNLLISSEGAENALNRITQADVRDSCGKAPEIACDLSLQLGLFSDPCTSMEKSWARETEDAGSSSSQEGSKFSDLSPQQNKEFCFFPSKSASDPFESCSSKWNSEGEGLNTETTVRKRKAPSSNNVRDGQFYWQPELPSDQFTGRIKWPGL